MRDYLIVAVNREQARFFTLEPQQFPQWESGPRIQELEALINPEAMAPAQERYADSKTGRGSAPGSVSVHGYDDKRDQHLDELRRRFAGRVLEHIRRQARGVGRRSLIVAASVRMRRFLTPDLNLLARQGWEIHRVSKNLIRLSPHQIHAQLARLGLVPQQSRPSRRPKRARLTPAAGRRTRPP
jgi:hypothetical protein